MSNKYEKLARGAAAGLAAGTLAVLGSRAEAQPAGRSAPEQTRLIDQSKDPYQYGARVLEAMNTGPRDENIICNCAVVIPSGTRVEKAPMSALDYKIKPGEVLLIQFPRLYKKGKNLWAGAWEGTAAGAEQVSDARYYRWVNLTQASKRPGYGVYNVSTYNPDDSRDYPFTFPVGSRRNFDRTNDLMVYSPGGPVFANQIAASTIERRDSIDAKLGRLEFVPAEKPVRFIKASDLPPINPDSAYSD